MAFRASKSLARNSLPKCGDSFNRPDGTPLLTSDTGQAWQGTTGSFPFDTFQGGGRCTVSGANRAPYVDFSGFPDVKVRVKFKNMNLTNQGIVLRASSNSAHYMARFGGTSVNLFVRIAGSYTQIGVGTTTAPVDGDECYFMASGDYLEAGINGVAIAFATDTTYLTATGVGWRVNSSTTILCDSFDVEPLAVPSTADVAWTANFSANGLNDYENVIHRETASVVDDPILGSSRKVLKLTVPNSAIGPTSNPRCQLTPPRRLVADNEFYAGLSILFPSSDFPTVMPVSSSGFLNVAQLFGPPFSSSAPWKLGFRADGTRKLQWKRNGSYSDTAWITPSDVVLDHWYDFVVHMKMSNDPTVGFVEMWMNEGAGWVQQVLSGELKLQMKTQDALTNIIGPSAIDAQLYRLVDMFSSVTVYIGHHSVGHSFDDVKPHSYI